MDANSGRSGRVPAPLALTGSATVLFLRYLKLSPVNLAGFILISRFVYGQTEKGDGWEFILAPCFTSSRAERDN